MCCPVGSAFVARPQVGLPVLAAAPRGGQRIVPAPSSTKAASAPRSARCLFMVCSKPRVCSERRRGRSDARAGQTRLSRFYCRQSRKAAAPSIDNALNMHRCRECGQDWPERRFLMGWPVALPGPERHCIPAALEGVHSAPSVRARPRAASYSQQMICRAGPACA